MLLTSKELADRWQMTEQTLRQWRLANKGPRYIKLGDNKKAAVRYLLEDIEKWEADHGCENA